MDKTQFSFLLLDLCEEYGASCLDESSQIYIDKLYDEFQSVQTKKELKPLLQERIAKDFRYFVAKPQWVLEPEWPFIDGEPMVFVGQLTAPQDEELEMIAGSTEDKEMFIFTLLVDDGQFNGRLRRVAEYRTIVQFEIPGL